VQISTVSSKGEVLVTFSKPVFEIPESPTKKTKAKEKKKYRVLASQQKFLDI
jgi:hypothetical protein